MHHSDIIGKWKIIRYIEDKLNQKNFELLGSATFMDKDSFYQYSESGVLKSDFFQSKAHQDYVWILKPDGWKINFSDGSHFHDLALANEEQQVYHKCINDIYNGKYILNLPNEFDIKWNVRGPRKEYISHTYYNKI